MGNKVFTRFKEIGIITLLCMGVILSKGNTINFESTFGFCLVLTCWFLWVVTK